MIIVRYTRSDMVLYSQFTPKVSGKECRTMDAVFDKIGVLGQQQEIKRKKHLNNIIFGMVI